MPREDTVRTREGLLKAACEIFADKGYRDTTIAEISDRAGANIAAVNYHFGSKETLYIEAWRRAFQESLKAHPPDGGVNNDAPTEERLRGHVTATLHRMTDKNNREFWFVQREIANPTGLLQEVMDKEIYPLHKKMEGFVRELLGPAGSDQDVQFCEASVINQCINPRMAGEKSQEKEAARIGPPAIKDIEAYADHVVEFSLAGIRAIRERAEANARIRQNEAKRT
jgi:AcrR family transcriptional regulator